MKTPLLFLGLLLAGGVVRAQSVGIGTPSPDASSALEVRNTAKGLLIPRVALGSLTDASTIASPAVSLLVYNTNAALSGGRGYYFNAGSSAAPQWQRLVTQPDLDATNANVGTLTTDLAVTNAVVADLGTSSWRTAGNAPSALAKLGTTNNQSFDLVANNVVRGRISNLGEFFWGATSTALAGDLLNAVGNSSFPYAVNGYTAASGAAVYGLRLPGATGTYGAVMGETDAAINANNSAVHGSAGGTSHRGVLGQKPAGGTGWGGLFLNDLGYTGFFGVASDQRVKTNIAPITGALAQLQRLRGTTYRYAAPYAAFLGGEATHYGFIAQELEAVFPDMVRAKSFTPTPGRLSPAEPPPIDIKAISTVSLIPVLVEGIKEQQQLISTQQQQLESQQQRLAALEARLQALEKR